MGPLETLLRARLTQAFAPQALSVTNESHLHAGHAGNTDAHGETHFNVVIVYVGFTNQPRVQRHKTVYAALGDLMGPGRIHALALTTRTPHEE